MTTRFRLQYTRTDINNDTELDVDISFENVDYIKLRDHLNTWLDAIGMQLVVKHKYSEAKAVSQVDLTGEED